MLLKLNCFLADLKCIFYFGLHFCWCHLLYLMHSGFRALWDRRFLALRPWRIGSYNTVFDHFQAGPFWSFIFCLFDVEELNNLTGWVLLVFFVIAITEMVRLLGIAFERFILNEILNRLYFMNPISLESSGQLRFFKFEYLMVEVITHGDDVGFFWVELSFKVQVQVFSFLLELFITVGRGSGGLFLARSDFQLVERHSLIETYFYY